MPRPQLHTTDAMLDAARDLLIRGGSGGATIEAIAGASGAPTGSIYHRFGSRDELIARLWIRAVERSQVRFMEALEGDDPRDAAVDAALSIIDFCEGESADARLLVSFRREDLMREARGELAEALEALNRPVLGVVRGLARRLYGTSARPAIDRVLLATFDLPYGAARRYLITGEALPAGLREDVRAAVEAVLDRPLARGG
jgi:AcrR family transcriptional regulator